MSRPLPPKKKTRGVAGPQTEQEERSQPTGQPDTLRRFYLEARALKVFRTLFYAPSISATPGEIAWADFPYAMTSVGFEIEKLYGSIWQFTPTKLDVERSIHFHEPHPSGKLRYVVARRFGRRLHRAYGLDGSCFVKKET